MTFRSSHAAVIVVSVALLLAATSNIGDTLIVDEIPHIGSGYSYAATGDFRLNPEHPPLAKTMAGLAILPVTDGTGAFASTHWKDAINGQWNFGRLLIYNSGNDADLITLLARLPMLLFLILSAAVLWRWAATRYGDTAALIAVILLTFSPTVLAHTRYVTTDMAAAWGVLIATFFFIRYLKKPTRRSFILASLALGLGLLTKFSTVLLGPFFILLAILWTLTERHGNLRGSLKPMLRWVGRTILVGTASFVFVVWPVYWAHTHNYPVERQVRDTFDITADDGFTPGVVVVNWLADKPILRAAGHYGLGVMMVAQRNAGGNTVYWMGNVVKSAGPWYFPTVYFLKESLAWWFLAALAVGTLVVRSRREHAHAHKPRKNEWLADHFDELAMLLWLSIYWGFSLTSTLNIGVRHLLPVFPFTILLVAGRLGTALDWLKRYDKARLKWASGIMAVLLGWYVFEAVSVFPHFLTYFNQFAGGPSGGHRYVVDSNLDWGQDARRLSKYMDANGIEKVSLDYFGWADPSYYLPDGRIVWTTVGTFTSSREFIENNRSDGWIAVSATFLQNSNGFKTFDRNDKKNYHWLTLYEPSAVIGNSIFLWKVE